jgi:hypothetical protein
MDVPGGGIVLTLAAWKTLWCCSAQSLHPLGKRGELAGAVATVIWVLAVMITPH